MINGYVTVQDVTENDKRICHGTGRDGEGLASRFPTKILYAFLIAHVCYVAHPSHHSRFDQYNNSTNHKAPSYVFFSILLSLPPA